MEEKKYWDEFKRIAKDREIEAGWSKVEKDSVAQKDGVYVFKCIGDNHDIWEAHELKKGESLHYFFIGDHQHSDGWWPIVVPTDYLVIPSFREGIPEWKRPIRQPKIGESMRFFNNGGFVIIALKINGKIKYYDQMNCPYMDYKSQFINGAVFFDPIWDIHVPEDMQEDFTLLGFYTIG